MLTPVIISITQRLTSCTTHKDPLGSAVLIEDFITNKNMLWWSYKVFVIHQRQLYYSEAPDRLEDIEYSTRAPSTFNFPMRIKTKRFLFLVAFFLFSFSFSPVSVFGNEGAEYCLLWHEICVTSGPFFNQRVQKENPGLQPFCPFLTIINIFTHEN